MSRTWNDRNDHIVRDIWRNHGRIKNGAFGNAFYGMPNNEGTLALTMYARQIPFAIIGFPVKILKIVINSDESLSRPDRFIYSI